MPPAVLSDETTPELPYTPSTSKQWLVQVAILFGLLVLGHSSRHITAPPQVVSAAAPLRPTAGPPAVAQVPR